MDGEQLRQNSPINECSMITPLALSALRKHSAVSCVQRWERVRLLPKAKPIAGSAPEVDAPSISIWRKVTLLPKPFCQGCTEFAEGFTWMLPVTLNPWPDIHAAWPPPVWP